MMIKTKAYITSKKDEPLKSCQDAYDINKRLYRYAVADGATREFFSAKLATKLVKRFCSDKDEINMDILNSQKYQEWLQPIQQSWLSDIEEIIKNKDVNSFVKNAFNRRYSGASTFVGLELDRDNMKFTYMIIGDSCLFHIRDNKILKCYLIDDYTQFDNSPDFFFSRTHILNNNYEIKKREFTNPKVESESFEEGDYFLLATDAISKWLLMQNHKGLWQEEWSSLLKKDKNWYDNFIDEKRRDKENKLDNDDVTILIISTDNSKELIPFEFKKKEKSKEILPKINILDYKVFTSNTINNNLSFYNIKEDKIDQEIKTSTTGDSYQKVFIVMYKTLATQQSRVLKSYLKDEVEDKGFYHVRQKMKMEIESQYKEGIIFFDYTYFNKLNGGIIENCFIYYKFSKKKLDDSYKFDKAFNSYIQKVEDIHYADIWKTNKISTILKEY